MAERQHKTWRELCTAALEAKDPDELLIILQELNRALKREEQIRRDFREASRTGTSPLESDVHNSRQNSHPWTALLRRTG